MTAQEKAKAGVWLLRKAVLDYLGTRPEGASASEVRQALVLEDADAEGQREGYLLWGLQNLLIQEGKVQIDRNSRPHRIMLRR